MNEIFRSIWRAVMMQFSTRARNAVTTKVSQGMNAAEKSLSRKKKKD